MPFTDVQPVVTKPRSARVADPCIMVIFGFSGDLTRRKLIPALYNLASQNLLSPDFAIIGLGRSPMSDEDARTKATEDFKKFASGPIDQKIWDDFVQRIHYISGDFDNPDTSNNLKEVLTKVDRGTRQTWQFLLLSRDCPEFLWRYRRTPRQSRPHDRGERPLAPRDH